jgi:hypothetical protein
MRTENERIRANMEPIDRLMHDIDGLKGLRSIE